MISGMDRTDEYQQLIKQYVNDEVQAIKDAITHKSATGRSTIELQHKLHELQTITDTIDTPSAIQYTPFTTAAQAIYNTIIYTLNYINKYKLSYLLIHTQNINDTSNTILQQSMNELQRNEYEQYITEFIQSTNHKLDILNQSIKAIDNIDDTDDIPHINDTITYQHSVLKQLYSSIQSVVELYGSIRLQYTQQLKSQVIDLSTIDYNDDTLSGTSNQSEIQNVWKSVTTGKYNKRYTPMNSLRNKIINTTDFDNDNVLGRSQHNSNNVAHNNNELVQQWYEAPVDDSQGASIEFSAQEQLLYESENQSLLQSLETNLDSMKTAEKKLVEISDMLTMFTTKIEEQSDTIELIESNINQTNINIDTGIEHLKKAVASSAQGTQFNIFVLLVMSFSLLFLDWFNS